MKRTAVTLVVAAAALLARPLCARAAGPAAAEPQVLGYQVDVSRDKVPTRASLHRIVDVLSSLGYNQLQLYVEHTFAYPRHEAVWAEASPLTPEDVRELDAYAAERGIELVPNQNSLGHLENWLCHPEYNALAELGEGGAVMPSWGNAVMARSRSLCPTDPRALEFVAGLYDELLPCFRSRWLNVGCDEPIELLDPSCRGRSGDELRAKGEGRVYLDWLLKIHRLAAERHHRIMFWGDVILRHPEFVPEIPEDVVCLDWGYEANHPFEREAALFADSGRRFLVCPGTSAWRSISGRLGNMTNNVAAAVAAGRRHGALGILLSDWGDEGHANPFIVSLPALVYTALRARGEEVSRARLARELDRVLGCASGEALLDYGDVYEAAGVRPHNRSEVFSWLRGEKLDQADDEHRAAVLAAVARAQAKVDLEGAPDWVRDGFATLELLYRALALRFQEPDKVNFRAVFEPEYRRLWLRHNRRGGLADSLTRIFGPLK